MILITDGSVRRINFPQFSAGEYNVNLDVYFKTITAAEAITVVPDLTKPDGFLELAMTSDAIRRINSSANLNLLIGYFPYSRQDRVCNEGEALGAKVMADLINSLKFGQVVVIDPHSDVVCAALDNAIPVTQEWILSALTLSAKAEITRSRTVLVSPDAGANKKTQAIAKAFGKSMYIRADKTRDTTTGAITGTVVYADDLTGQNCMIVDDICDGGYTFIKLAEALKAKGAEKVSLFVTHGIFSKGMQPLIDGGIDHVYTTDTFLNEPSDFLTISSITSIRGEQ